MYPLFNLLKPCPNEKHNATSIKMRPSTVITTIGTLRYLNQNEQHYTTLCYPLFYFWKLCQNCSGHKYWNIALKVRSGRHGAIHITIDIKHSKVYKVSTTYLNQNETLWARVNTPNKLQSEHQFHKPNPCSRNKQRSLQWAQVPQTYLGIQ